MFPSCVGELFDFGRLLSTFGAEFFDAFFGAYDPCLQRVNVGLAARGGGGGVGGGAVGRALGEEEAREQHFADYAATLRATAAALAKPSCDACLVEDVAALACRYRIARLEMLHANDALSFHFSFLFLFVSFCFLFNLDIFSMKIL